MNKIFILFFSISFLVKAQAQNLYPKKLENCITTVFCLDCGDVKADLNKEKLEGLIKNITISNNLEGVKGKVLFQILVDSSGKGCVLSHTDVTNNIITQNIVKLLNSFDGFIPAKTKEKNEQRTSFNIAVEIKEAKINIHVERVDMKAFEASFDHPEKPEIFNKNYTYKNESLKNYEIQVWNSKNSNLLNNQVDHITIDKNDIVWLTVNEGLMKFDGQKFINAEQNITSKGKYFNYFALATANDNTKWVYGSRNIYSYNNEKWTKYDSSSIGIDGAYNIYNIERTGEIFFCADEGLLIYKNNTWKLISKDSIPQIPISKIYCAYRDSKNRLWIVTFKGIIMLDKNGVVTEFEKSNTILKGRNFTSVIEDQDGNLYFGLYKNDKGTEKNSDEGIGILNKDGNWKKLTTENSGMPENYTNKLFYDKFEKVIWIATNSCGIVRFDFKNNIWEIFHNENSAIPTAWITDIEQDSKGNIYLGTRQGLVKIQRK